MWTNVAPAAERAFELAFGRKVAAFRDAMVDYALALKARARSRAPDFVVTPEMRASSTTHDAARDRVNRAMYDAAAPLVTRILGAQIARYVFGPDAEFARTLRNDRSLAVSLQLLNGVKSERELLDRAATMAAARADTTKAK